MSFADIASALAHRGGRFLLPASQGPLPAPGVRDNARSLTVTADDGVELHVEVDEAAGSRPTVIFCHGYLLNSTSWHVQRAALAGRFRVVLWDHRGHGRSGWGTPSNASIDQVGRDLYAVIQATTPRGPVVLVGHSMGGMAILALAQSHPELFGDRVTGVVLSSASAGGLASVTAGLPVRTARFVHRVVPVTLATLRRQARLVDGARRSVGGVTYLVTWPYLYGSRVPRPVARLTARLMASVPIQVIAEFYSELVRCDLHTGLPVLARVPVLVMVGERDLITPLAHAEALAAAIPGAELAVIPDAGHLLILERPREVSEQILSLLTRATKRIDGIRTGAAARHRPGGVPARRIGRPAGAPERRRGA
jgi:pimeloyl-ACP methyl ester carboxylesterase